MQAQEYMQRALDLARQGRPWPNPYVGAVVVKDGEIVGAGYHPKAGEAHAEVFALRQAGEKARGATLYVTLEPCCHTGRTPPCTEAILKAGISRVVAATCDPNPKVCGRGLAILRAAGLEVQHGLLAEQARKQNEVFFHAVLTARPYFTLKLAQSLDGKIATQTGQSRWLTGNQARGWVHQLRDRSQAIMVGIGTVRADDPLLNTRLPGGHDPIRIIVDTEGSLPLSAKLWSVPSPIIVAAGRGAAESRLSALRGEGAEVLVLSREDGRVNLAALAAALFQRGITDVLVEGGAALAGALLQANLVDKFHLFLAPLVLGGKNAPSSIGGPGWSELAACPKFVMDAVERLGEDLLLTLYPEVSSCLQASLKKWE